MEVWRRILVPVELYSPAGEVAGVALGVGIGVAVGLVEADGLLEGVLDGLGEGVVEGLFKAPLSKKAAEIATATITMTPNAIRIFLFLALVFGLFLPHSGL
jgi:hypothetical protein